MVMKESWRLTFSPCFSASCNQASVMGWAERNTRSPTINSRLCWLSPLSIRSLILPSASTQATASVSASQTISNEANAIHARTIARSCFLPQLTVTQTQTPLAARGQLLVMSDQNQRGGRIAVQREQEIDDALTGGAIQIAGWFIGEK